MWYIHIMILKFFFSIIIERIILQPHKKVYMSTIASTKIRVPSFYYFVYISFMKYLQHLKSTKIRFEQLYYTPHNQLMYIEDDAE